MTKRSLLLLCLLTSGCAGARTFSADQAFAVDGSPLRLVSLAEPAPFGREPDRAALGAPVDLTEGPDGRDEPPAPNGPPAAASHEGGEGAGELTPPDLLEGWPSPEGYGAAIDLDLVPDETPAEPSPDDPPSRRNLLRDVLVDHANFYSLDTLVPLLAGVGVAAALANTSADESIRHFYQENVRDVRADEYFEAIHAPGLLGNGKYVIPVFAGAAAAGYLLDGVPFGEPIGQWGGRSLRAVLVGGPPLLAMQVITGASRPGETPYGSHWRPWQDTNGASGHAFIGAIPFLTAAKMTDNYFWKAGLYFASTLPGLSRINDDHHYASQVILGWGLAYLAATAVDNTHRGENHLAFFPMPINDGVGIGLEWRR